MSRSGYTDNFGDEDPLAMGRWRQAVRLAIKGKRGQALLRATLAALDAMPVKELAAESLVTADGEFCTLGALGHCGPMRGWNQEHVATVVVPARNLPERRWHRMRAWVASKIVGPASTGSEG